MISGNVVVVAPFSPDGPPAHLGAAKKIELVLALLYKLGFEIHLVDSSHPTLAFARAVNARACLVGNTPVTLWRPFCIPNRQIGKLLQLAIYAKVCRRLVELSPKFVWTYNAYCFEALAALYLKRRAGSRIVLELEDLPLARRRAFNPKPFLDQYFFAPLLAATDLLTCVNASMQKKFTRPSLRTLLFPSLLQQSLIDFQPAVKFSCPGYRLGYFGGLEGEKGADVLLEVLSKLPDDWKLVVTGSGSRELAFTAAQQRFPGRLEFHGFVGNEEMLLLMQSCDAIVNPHASISEMHDGVFPFKVCEALACGALVISTDLPSIDIDLSTSVLFFDGSASGLIDALVQAADFYKDRAKAIDHTRLEVCNRFGEAAVLTRLRVELEALSHS